MNEPTILMNEDAMEEAWKMVRGPKAAPGSAVAAGAGSETISPPSRRAAATTAPTNGSDALRQLLTLRQLKGQHEDALKGINAEIDTITASILDRWADEGVDSMRVDGKTVSLRRQVYARVLDREHVAAALQEAGLGHLLTPNTNTLSAWLREKEEAQEPLPPSLEGIVGTYERFSLSVRNGRQ